MHMQEKTEPQKDLGKSVLMLTVAMRGNLILSSSRKGRWIPGTYLLVGSLKGMKGNKTPGPLEGEKQCFL